MMINQFYIKDKNFSEEVKEDVVYGFFTRKGGVSKGSFNSLNCSFNNGDRGIDVKRNREIVCNIFKINPSRLMTVNQIHSNKIVDIDQNNLGKKIYADGMITSEKNLLLGILTADCAPILFSGECNIAVLHVGWRGLLKGIVDRLIRIFLEKGEDVKRISCIIGPHLAPESFEVKNDFVLQIQKVRPLFSNFIDKDEGVLRFNFLNCLKESLRIVGLKKIFTSRLDTFSNPELFFSYRFNKAQGLKCGRQISIIGKR